MPFQLNSSTKCSLSEGRHDGRGQRGIHVDTSASATWGTWCAGPRSLSEPAERIMETTTGATVQSASNRLLASQQPCARSTTHYTIPARRSFG